MQSLSGKNLETVIYKLFVFGKRGAFQDLISSITFIIEQGVADVFEVSAYLMGPSGLQATLHKGDIGKSLQHTEMGNCMFALITIRIDRHL